MSLLQTAPLLAIVGPTASGKTRRAVACARALGGEIVSADSRQVYQGMDLGTGKDLDEYGSIPYHLIDIAPAGAKYNLFQYLRDARAAVADIQRRGRTPVVCGGTGMYVEALLKGTQMPQVPVNEPLRTALQHKSIDQLAQILAGYKTLHNVTDLDSPQRAVRAIEIQEYYLRHPDESANVRVGEPLPAVIIGVDIPRQQRRQRISQRLEARVDAGMLQEVQRLLDSGIPADDLIYYGLEYKFLTLHLTGHLSRQEMLQQLQTAIHQFAKRQMTWFRGMERRGLHINWLPWDLPEEEFTRQAMSLYHDFKP